MCAIMATSVQLQYDFPKELMFQLPFISIFDFAKKQRVPHWREIEAEVEIIARDNRAEIEDLLGNAIIKAMTEDVKLGNISDDTLKEVKDKIDYLNSKFKYVNDYFESLGAYDQRDLLLPFIEKEINSLVKFKEKFKITITSKEKWNLNDSLMYSYYLLYLDSINVWRTSLKKASRDNIGGRINILKSLIFIYKPLLVAYMLNKKLPNEIVVKRIAELRAGINPRGVYTAKPEIDKINQAISTIAPI